MLSEKRMNSDEENYSPGGESPQKQKYMTPAQVGKVRKEPLSITPFKSPNTNKLPPLPKGSNVLPKRRKISNDVFSTPSKPIDNSYLIPHKSRSFSTPVPKRIPSLQETPIPDLTPPTSKISNELSFNNSLSTNMEASSSPSKKPLHHQDLSFSHLSSVDNSIDLEASNLKEHIDRLLQYKSVKSEKESEELDLLIKKSREALIKSSKNIFNEFKVKVSEMGGWKEFKKYQLHKLQQLEIHKLEELLDQLHSSKGSCNKLDQVKCDQIDAEINEIESQINSLKDENRSDDISDVEFDNDNDELKEVLKNFGVDKDTFELIYGK